MWKYFNEYITHVECYNDETLWVLCQYFHEYIHHNECSHHATRYELCF